MNNPVYFLYVVMQQIQHLKRLKDIFFVFRASDNRWQRIKTQQRLRHIQISTINKSNKVRKLPRNEYMIRLNYLYYYLIQSSSCF